MSSTPGSATSVRAVVVNYNGGTLVERCVEHLLATEWPAGAFDVVVVDNASTDGSGDAVARRFPDVRVVHSPANLGFAGGNNLALRALDGVDVVTLVNSDAFVEPDWLHPLVETLHSAPDVGAANAKLLLEPRFAAVHLDSEVFTPGGDDPRTLGVRVLDVECGGVDVWRRSLFPDGFHGPEASAEEPHFRWSQGRATIWVALPPKVELPTTVRLRLQADRPNEVKVTTATTGEAAITGDDHTWVELLVDGPVFDVLNNAGNVLVEGGYGADRGFRQLDEGQFDHPAEVFAWCGAAVALRPEYLVDAGVFDDRYFLYYEDFDLSWRGRLRGWRYVYTPHSRARHVHAATTVEGSALFDHYVQRNRLLTLVKNAPADFAARQVAAYLRELWGTAHREVIRPVLRGRRPHPDYTRRRLRSLGAFLKHLPRALADRRRIGRRARVDRAALLEWSVPQS